MKEYHLEILGNDTIYALLKDEDNNYFNNYREDSYVCSGGGLLRTIKSERANMMWIVVEDEKMSELKKELCNELIENNLVEEGDMIYHSYTNNRLSGTRDINTTQNTDKNIGATLTTRPDTLGIVVKDEIKLVGGIGEKKSNNGTQYYQQDRVYDSENIALCQSANEGFNPWYKSGLRIRKLTPKECWRLMGFDDDDFTKAEKVNSNAQLYRQAGNSIVVNVLEAIFKEML